MNDLSKSKGPRPFLKGLRADTTQNVSYLSTHLRQGLRGLKASELNEAWQKCKWRCLLLMEHAVGLWLMTS